MFDNYEDYLYSSSKADELIEEEWEYGLAIAYL